MTSQRHIPPVVTCADSLYLKRTHPWMCELNKEPLSQTARVTFRPRQLLLAVVGNVHIRARHLRRRGERPQLLWQFELILINPENNCCYVMTSLSHIRFIWLSCENRK